VSNTKIFVAVFLLLTAITLIVPNIPPSQLLFNYITIPQSTRSVLGISVATVVNGVANGIIWGLLAAAVYALYRRHSEHRELQPLPAATKLTTPPPEAVLDWHTDRIPPSITVRRKKRKRKEQDIETIEGIGSIRAQLLRRSGIKTIDDLLKVGATRRGRQLLADEIGVTEITMLRWVRRGDLQRIKGVGRQYSALLESAGVNNVSELAIEDPQNLRRKLRIANRERRLVRRIPPYWKVVIWVDDAKYIEPIIR
jgi:predicted flap endonuclease-1-like 5' DNA nuclease